jgi:hypothetical protein
MATDHFVVTWTLRNGAGTVQYRTTLDQAHVIVRGRLTATLAKRYGLQAPTDEDLEDRGLLRWALAIALWDLVGSGTAFVAWDGPQIWLARADQLAALRVVDPDALPDEPDPSPVGFRPIPV